LKRTLKLETYECLPLLIVASPGGEGPGKARGDLGVDGVKNQDMVRQECISGAAFIM
jgi:hypothetical protein